MTLLAKLGVILAMSVAVTTIHTVYSSRLEREAWRKFNLRMELMKR